MEYLKIVIVGAGNVAWHLAKALEAAGHQIEQVYSRNLAHAERLCQALYNANPTDSLDFEESEASLFLIAVADQAIETVSKSLIVPVDAIVAHTSGSTGLSVFEGRTYAHGVMYPLQTFSMVKKVNFEEIPVLIEANSDAVNELLTLAACSISRHVFYAEGQKRLALHVAAVFINNFGNHLATLAKGITDSEDINFEVLHPLLRETMNKIVNLGPEKSQTGPALRGDGITIEKHMEYLSANLELRNLYRLLSDSIIKNG